MHACTLTDCLLPRVEAEQAASDKAFDDFQSDLVLSQIRTQVYKRNRPLYWELTARIAAAEAGKIVCTEGDVERNTKLLRVRRTLRAAVTGMFEAYDETLDARLPTDPVSDLDVAATKARACFQRLQTDEKTYWDMLDAAEPAPRTPAYSEALKVRKIAEKALIATRKTYRVLENDLLVNIAAPLLGERARLVSSGRTLQRSRDGIG